MRGWLAVILVAGCGDDDCCIMKPIDAAIDTVMIDGPNLPVTHHYYVIDGMQLPTSNTQARDFGLDLDGNSIVDNQLGFFSATLTGMALDPQAEVNQVIDTGAAIMLADLGADDLITESTATFTLYQGSDPIPAACTSPQDTVCRQHLTGSGTFLRQPTPNDPPLVGAIINNNLDAGPGHLTIQLTFWGTPPLRITMLGARVQVAGTASTFTGKLAGALSKSDVDNRLLPAMRDGYEATVMRDCTMLTSPPACGCPTGSKAKTMLGLLDTAPQDCSISLAEVQTNSLFVSLLSPDVTVEGVQALSFGVKVHAVGAFIAEPI
jgi:hypothetical protein